MSGEIWQIGQKMTASEMYDDVRENGINGCRLLRSETIAVVKLTAVCSEMIATYNEISDDQTEYLVELENENTQLENITSDAEARIKQLMAEIKELEKKKESGTLTEEEEADLESKKTELADLQSGSQSQIKTIKDKLTSDADERVNASRSKVKIANDYGETTVEKGTPLAETEVKGGFFRKLFGSTGRDKKSIGEKAVKTGNELLDKVSESVELDTQITAQLSKHVKK